MNITPSHKKSMYAQIISMKSLFFLKAPASWLQAKKLLSAFPFRYCNYDNWPLIQMTLSSDSHMMQILHNTEIHFLKHFSFQVFLSAIFYFFYCSSTLLGSLFLSFFPYEMCNVISVHENTVQKETLQFFWCSLFIFIHTFLSIPYCVLCSCLGTSVLV